MTGYPMLMGDPHLESGLPNLIIINELIWQDKFMIGGSLPGIPLVALGRGKNLSFAHTTPNCDSSDLWQETLDETGTKYFLDGQWKDLEITTETIKVKKQDDYELVVRKTHRGALVSMDLLIGAN